MMNFLSIVATAVLAAPSGGGSLSDVPSGHWAAKAAQDLVGRGIMTAPGGKFDGDRAVTRRELTIAMAAFAKSLLDRKWTVVMASAAPREVKTAGKTVSRYELAAAIEKIGSHASAGLLPAGPKPFYGSEVFPRSATVKAKSTEPGFAAAQYLAKEHMAFGDSVTLAPGPASVTPAEAKKAITQVLIGLVDRLTDEPQNREEIAPPPRHDHK